LNGVPRQETAIRRKGGDDIIDAEFEAKQPVSDGNDRDIDPTSVSVLTVGLHPINRGQPIAYDESNAGLYGNDTGLAGFSSR